MSCVQFICTVCITVYSKKVIILQRTDYLFLIKRLIEKGLLGEEEVGSHWPKLSALSWPEVLCLFYPYPVC